MIITILIKVLYYQKEKMNAKQLKKVKLILMKK